MNEEKFQALYKNTKKEEIIKELYLKCKANYELENIIKEVREYLTEEGVCILNKGMEENERLVWDWQNYYEILEILDKENK